MRLGDQRGDEDSVMRISAGLRPQLALALAGRGLPPLAHRRAHLAAACCAGSARSQPVEIDRCLERWLKGGVIELVRSARGRGRAAARPRRRRRPRRSEAARGGRRAARGRRLARARRGGAAGAARLRSAARASRTTRSSACRATPTRARSRRRTSRSRSGCIPTATSAAQLGAFAPLVETCFKKLLEAYELLSDPQTRAEVQARTRRARGRRGAARALSSLDVSRRLRERVGALAGAKRASEERRRKAKGFFEAGMAAFAKERWLEAAGSVRLAIAFDPENEAYREQFASVQRKAHDERARDAREAGRGRARAARLPARFDACSRRPCTTGRPIPSSPSAPPRLAWQALGELRRAKELAVHAVELAPDNGSLPPSARPRLQGRGPRCQREARARGRAADRSAGRRGQERPCVDSERVRREGMPWAE